MPRTTDGLNCKPHNPPSPPQDLERKIRRYRHREERVDERVVWVYLVQTLEALQALHSLKILHRGVWRCVALRKTSRLCLPCTTLTVHCCSPI